MMKFKRFVCGTFCLMFLLLNVGLVSAQEARTLVVFAAASLTDVFTEIADAFMLANPAVKVIFNFGSSSTLATQLVEGTPADVFASANIKQMAVVEEAGLLEGEPVLFARNHLVLAVPADNPANIQSLADLAVPGVKLILAAPGVPVRDYTDTMLGLLAEDPRYGASYHEMVVGNIVSEEDNVRQVVAKLALGEADAGVVYSSDITPDITDTVLALPIPDEVNTTATYPVAVLRESQQTESAHALVDFVLSDQGQDILVKWGFLSVRPSNPHTPSRCDN